MPVPSYRYGKVDGTYPLLTVISERIEKPMVCCGYAAAHMAAFTARTGVSKRLVNEGHEMRTLGGRPHNAGSNASELRTGCKAATNVNLVALAKSSIPDRLAKGFAVVINLSYEKLPPELQVQSNAFGHTALLFGSQRGMVGYFDPLWDQGSSGAWVPWQRLLPALWGDGAHSTTVTRLAPSHTVHIAHGATVRTYAVSSKGCILKVNGSYGKDTKWTRPDSHADCNAPVHRNTCDGLSGANTVRVISGAFAGKTIRVDPASGVTVS